MGGIPAMLQTPFRIPIITGTARKWGDFKPCFEENVFNVG